MCEELSRSIDRGYSDDIVFFFCFVFSVLLFLLLLLLLLLCVCVCVCVCVLKNSHNCLDLVPSKLKVEFPRDICSELNNCVKIYQMH